MEPELGGADPHRSFHRSGKRELRTARTCQTNARNSAGRPRSMELQANIGPKIMVSVGEVLVG
jgi:hypothetical protein